MRYRTWAVAAAFMFCASSAHADPVGEFFKGKTVSMVIGLSTGGDYDLRARMLVRHMPRHVPGNPIMVPRNMPGAGGLAAANWLMRAAPRDGTAILMVTQNMPLAQATGLTGVEFDARQFHWIGNTTDTPNVITVWAASGVRSDRAPPGPVLHLCRLPGRAPCCGWRSTAVAVPARWPGPHAPA